MVEPIGALKWENWLINGEIGKWEMRHRRKIDKDWKGEPIGFAFPPPSVSHMDVLFGFIVLPFASISRPAGFTILPFLRPYRFYRFTIFTKNFTVLARLLAVPFLHSHQVSALPVISFLPFLLRPGLPFYHFYLFGHFGSLVGCAVFVRINSWTSWL